MRNRDTRAAILEAAITLMGAEGYEGLSASKLAAAAGISKANLFHHFHAISDIPVAAFDLMSDQMFRDASFEGEGLRDLVVVVGEAAFAVYEERRDFVAAYVSFLNRAMFEEDLGEKVRASLNRSKDQLLDLFATRTADRDEALDLVNMVLALLDGALMHMLLLDNPQEIQRMWNRFVLMFARGVSK